MDMDISWKSVESETSVDSWRGYISLKGGGVPIDFINGIKVNAGPLCIGVFTPNPITGGGSIKKEAVDERSKQFRVEKRVQLA